MLVRNIRLDIRYDGTAYHGSQRQVSTEETVQGKIEDVLSRFFGKIVKITMAGRTDAGVHANRQVLNFKIQSSIPVDGLTIALNKILPTDIRVLRASVVEDNFSARNSAVSREYVYMMYVGNTNSIGIDRYCLKVDNRFDLELANQAAKIILRTKDFSSCMTSGSFAKSTQKKILKCECIAEEIRSLFFGEFKIIEFRINADSFLYNMVRILVANLIRVATGLIDLDRFSQILDSKDRQLAGKMAPARGLYLENVSYRQEG